MLFVHCKALSGLLHEILLQVQLVLYYQFIVAFTFTHLNSQHEQFHKREEEEEDDIEC